MLRTIDLRGTRPSASELLALVPRAATDVTAALNAAQTLPMFAKRRLVIARGLDELKSEGLEPLSGYLAHPNPTTCLALVGGAKVDGRLKVFQAVKKAGYLHEFAHLRDWQLGDWLQAEARRRSGSPHARRGRHVRAEPVAGAVLRDRRRLPAD